MLNLAHGAASVLGRPLVDDDADCHALSAEAEAGLGLGLLCSFDPGPPGRLKISCATPFSERWLTKSQ